jgi:predicted unusual protein kinase regulating ubiquinone biosynthesis (AarF/ABC1/UbiB family)
VAAPFLFANLIPAEYRPLLSVISPAAFSVVEWKQLLKEAPTLLRRFNKSDGFEKISNQLEALWPLASRDPKNLGEAVLQLYFAQIFNREGLFLDLRRKNFGTDKQQLVSFLPNGFWIQWQEPFRLGLLDIYKGYYEGQPELLDRGLTQVGLIHAKMSKEKISEVREMLLSHIGGNYKQQQFLVSDFTASFEKFFKFLLANKIRLNADFLYLGIYLASLYHCLQDVGGTYDVQHIYLKAQDHAK